MPKITEWMGNDPASFADYLQHGSDTMLGFRRAVVVASLVGIATMACTTLLRAGVVKNLPDPKFGRFRTRKVNSSREAYSYGGPDSPINIVAHGANIVMAATGGRDRTERQPSLPLAASLASAMQAAVAAKYLFHQMPKVDRAWCPYCIVDALTHFATFAFTLPEAIAAGRRLARR